jgi:hypothetical protein
MSPCRKDMYRFCIHVLLGGRKPRVNRGASFGAETLGINRMPLPFCQTRERLARLLHRCRIVELAQPCSGMPAPAPWKGSSRSGTTSPIKCPDYQR